MSDAEESDIESGDESGSENESDDEVEGSEDQIDGEADSGTEGKGSLVFDAGARMEMFLHRLRSLHLDALTAAAFGEPCITLQRRTQFL
jgi:hypothetical protein